MEGIMISETFIAKAKLEKKLFKKYSPKNFRSLVMKKAWEEWSKLQKLENAKYFSFGYALSQAWVKFKKQLFIDICKLPENFEHRRLLLNKVKLFIY
jgi:hypothetical protein